MVLSRYIIIIIIIIILFILAFQAVLVALPMVSYCLVCVFSVVSASLCAFSLLCLAFCVCSVVLLSIHSLCHFHIFSNMVYELWVSQYDS